MVGLAVTDTHSRKTIVGGRALIESVIEDFPPGGSCFYDYSRLLHSSLSSLGLLLTKRRGCRVSMLDAMEFWETAHCSEE